MNVYLVGGAVRDRLLGLPVRERDWVVVGATDDQLRAEGFTAKDQNFPVYTHPDTNEEYALARREVKRGQGHKAFDVYAGPDVTLAQDLARRDLTVNAMAEDSRGTVIDPFGGRIDLRRRTLRAVTQAFVEDPLRLLRLARFSAQLGAFEFGIEAGTERMATRMAKGEELSRLSGGRIWRETERALSSPRPERYFDCLLRWDTLTGLLPGLAPDGATRAASALQALARAAQSSESLGVRLASWIAASRGPQSSLQQPVDAELPIPRKQRELIELVVSQPIVDTRASAKLLELLEACDAFRRPDRFAEVLRVWKAVFGPGDARIARIEAAAKAASATPSPGTGDRPAQRLRTSRIAAISSALERCGQ